jgi:hypothetical protein
MMPSPKLLAAQISSAFRGGAITIFLEKDFADPL